MTRLGVALGANPLTFLGLSGVGDLVLTCAGDLSRNRTLESSSRWASTRRPTSRASARSLRGFRPRRRIRARAEARRRDADHRERL
jgi:hypothetical protein